MTTYKPILSPLLVVLVPLAVLACNGNGNGNGNGDGSTPDSGGPAGSIVGTFQVTLVGPVASTGKAGYTSVVGKVYDGPMPSAEIWEEAAAEGACKLLKPRIPFCETPCGGTAVCVEDGKCQPYPTAVGVGTVQLEGVQTESGTSFSMEPVANNYQPVGVTLKYPPFSEGDEVSLTAEDPKFTITGKGISELELLNAPIQLDPGQAATLSWTPPKQASIARIKVKLDISHHGGSKGKIECDVEDSGSLELPAALLDQLKGLGVSGFPTVAVTREAVASATGVDVDLAINSRVEQEVLIPGLVSCNDDNDCPTGQTCQQDLRCQ